MKDLRIYKIKNTILNSNSYIVHNHKSAIIIDIGEWETIKKYLIDHNLDLCGVFLTHTHFDHIYGIPDLFKDHSDITVYTSEFGKQALNNPKWNLSRYHNQIIKIDSSKITIIKSTDIIIPFPDCKVNVIETPGHDLSCITYKINDNLFTGDSYIPGLSVIATFPHSDKEMARLWNDRLISASASHHIFPGHDI